MTKESTFTGASETKPIPKNSVLAKKDSRLKSLQNQKIGNNSIRTDSILPSTRLWGDRSLLIKNLNIFISCKPCNSLIKS